MQPQDQQPVAIIARHRCVFDRAGKLNRLFKPTVGNFKLVMRDAFATKTVAAQTAYAQQRAINRDLHVLWMDPSQIDFHDPPVRRAIDISRGTPQPSRWSPLAILTNAAEVTIKRFAGHKSFR